MTAKDQSCRLVQVEEVSEGRREVLMKDLPPHFRQDWQSA
jgi:hypothetical protein